MPRPPKQARSRRTFQRLVDAALELVAERGVEETTIQDIVRRARSSVGSFYARFSGKEELIAYLEGQVWDDAVDRWSAALAGDGAHKTAGLEEAVREVVSTLVSDRQESALRRRAFHTASADPGTDPALRFEAAVLSLVQERLLAHRAEIRHPEPELAVELGFLAASGALRQIEVGRRFTVVREGESVAEPLSDEGLEGELKRLYLGYLGGSGDGAPTSGDPHFADPFDVWT